MRIAVTGGTGVVGTAIVREAVRRGHAVRALVRNPPDATAVEHDPLLKQAQYLRGDVTQPATIRGVFDDVDVIVHAAGIARQTKGENFHTVNVEGTRHLLAEAARSPRSPAVVFLSSLGADRGASVYHRSKRGAEMFVREYQNRWVILRPGNVYGPEGGQLALFTWMIRSLPLVPTAGNPDREFQPIAAADLASGVLECCERDSLTGRTLEVAGNDLTSQRDLHRRICDLVQRHPPLLRIPQPLVLAASRVLATVGIDPPVWRDQVTMVEEGNVLLVRNRNPLHDVLGVTPRSLDDGLRELTRDTPEQFPDVGSGPVLRRRFFVAIENSSMDAAALMTMVRREFASLMPDVFVSVGEEPVSDEVLRQGAVISLTLPVRRHVQVRVEEVTPWSVTCVTLEGHPLAGVVRFLSEANQGTVHFEVQTIDRPRTKLDRLVMTMAGAYFKRATWLTLIERVVERSGGNATGDIAVEETPLDELRSRRLEHWVHELVARRLEYESVPNT